MAISAFISGVSSLQTANAEIDTVSANIAASSGVGFKCIVTHNHGLYNGSGGASSSRSAGAGVTYKNSLTIDQAGASVRTNIATNVMIDGRGMFVVTDATNAKLYTRAGDFSINKNNEFENSTGYIAMGWPLNNDEELPDNKSMLESLQRIRIEGAIAEAAATTKVNVSILLNSSEEVAGMQKLSIGIADGSVNSPNNVNITSEDILYPNDYNSLTPGEGLTLKVSDKIYHLVYGGFAKTLSVPRAGTDLASNGTTKLATDQLSMSVEGFTHMPFTRGTGTSNLEVLNNLASQMNSTSGVYGITARVIDDGTNVSLLIAPNNANFATSFSGTAAFKSALGISDSSNVLADKTGYRFASMSNIKDILNDMPGVKATVTNDNRLNIVSDNAVYLENYNPIGYNSNFLREFGLTAGYLPTSYNPYDPLNNMAGGGFNANYTRDFIVYDAMGNAHNCLMRFLKTNTNKWATEVHVIDTSSVTIPGRTDGLLMAGYLEFDGQGNLYNITAIGEPSISNKAVPADTALGATEGQTLSISIGTSNYTYTYSNATAQSAAITGSGLELTSAGSGGTSTDTLDITVNGSIYSFQRGSGATNKEVLDDLASQINQTVGLNALRASVVQSAPGVYRLDVTALDKSKSVAFSSTSGTPAADLTATLIYTDITADANRFSTLNELAERINRTSGIEALNASVIPTDSTGTSYKISINPVNNGYYMNFGGSVEVIGVPLGNGEAMTIESALGLRSTSAQSQIASLNDSMTINWSQAIGAIANNISFGWGNIGKQDGLGQVAKDYSVRKLDQNGVSIGELVDLQVTEKGEVVANFSNSTSRRLYKMAIADVANINGLSPKRSGSVFSVADASGIINLKEAGKEGAGMIVSNVYEGANVDITSELSKIPSITLRFQGSVKVMGTVASLMDEMIHRSTA